VPSYPLTALVLRKTKLGETDVILTLLAEDGQQVRAVAKGLRKPGSRFGARLEPYAVVDLLMHTGKSLEVVTDARTVDTHQGLREDFDRSAAAAVVVDVLDKIALQGAAEPRLFALARATLDVMEAADGTALSALVVAFLLKAMAMHGYRPELDSCAACALPCEGGEMFSLTSGGVLCASCGLLDAAALRSTEAVRLWMKHLLGSTMAQIAADPPPAAAVADCFALTRSFVAYHLPTRLKALDFWAGSVG